MKGKIIMLLLCLLLSTQIKSQKLTPNIFIQKYENTAITLMKKHYIPASIILGISLLESGYGTSNLSKNKNNFFGIKKNIEYISYENDIESFNDFCKYISKRKYYENLKNQGIKDYSIWLNKIKESGYAEDINWTNKVESYIKNYKLYELDKIDENINIMDSLVLIF